MRTYFIKFKPDGTRDDTVPDFLSSSRGGKDKLLTAGYLEVSDEDYQYYAGNHGNGDNNNGYILGSDNKPVSAPAKDIVIEMQDTAPVDDTVVALAEAIAAQEERLAALENKGDK